MPLTKSECLVAAARAREWPVGRGSLYLRGRYQTAETSTAAKRLAEKPELERFG